MIGAEIVVRTLVNCGVDTCFANPGTSEMHFLSALDAVPAMRPVLALQENVATGAADGFARIAGRPAATLLHLGPGLANGLSNLHNAARALSPVVNIVGDHATGHRRLDAPLTSDIISLARTVGVSTRCVMPGRGAGAETAAAVADSLGPVPGVATLLLPADAAWQEAGEGVAGLHHEPGPATPPVDPRVVVAALRQPGAVLFLGHGAVRGKALRLAGQIARATGAALVAQTTNPVTDRGAGCVAVERLPFAPDLARERLASAPALVLAGARAPVAFFAYPGKPGRLSAPDTAVIEYFPPECPAIEALAALADACGTTADTDVTAHVIPDRPTGPLNAGALGAVLARHLVEGAVVVDEAITNGVAIAAATRGAAPHRWCQNMGGSIGYGAPLATGCAIADPTVPVVALIGDGSAMYTIQALWTHAREGLNVTTIILANRRYSILQSEVAKLDRRHESDVMEKMLRIDGPRLDFVHLARGMDVPAERVTTADALDRVLEEAMRTRGPMLIEVDL
ncbi:MAG: acetolactate synthase large subunit [Pararhodobacter sp.]|nr:acetolactate synthase large subunit [Pararhodobacter sp.]